MKLKTVEIEGTTYGVLVDGQPVFIETDGKENPYDVPGMHTSIGRLNNEAKTHREAKEAAELALKPFKGIDAAEATKALGIVSNLDEGKLVAAADVERAKEEAKRGLTEQLTAAKTATEKLLAGIASDKISLAFAGSEFVKTQLNILPDMAQATFGANYKFENDRITPLDAKGNPIYSKSNPGDVASFEESIAILVDVYPGRDRIMKGSGHSGSGEGELDVQDGKRTIKREAFDKLPIGEQSTMAEAAAKKELRIVD